MTLEHILVGAAAIGACLAAFLDHRNHRKLTRIEIKLNGNMDGLERRIKALEGKRHN